MSGTAGVASVSICKEEKLAPRARAFRMPGLAWAARAPDFFSFQILRGERPAGSWGAEPPFPARDAQGSAG